MSIDVELNVFSLWFHVLLQTVFFTVYSLWVNSMGIRNVIHNSNRLDPVDICNLVCFFVSLFDISCLFINWESLILDFRVSRELRNLEVVLRKYWKFIHILFLLFCSAFHLQFISFQTYTCKISHSAEDISYSLSQSPINISSHRLRPNPVFNEKAIYGNNPRHYWSTLNTG